MKLIALVFVSSLVACSHPSDATQPDASLDAPTGCTLEPRISRTQFSTESINYLRTAFATTTGFQGGAITYGETAVPLDDGPCPVADWTGLTYTVAIDPALIPIELRATHDRVAAMWWLNGRKAVAFVPTTVPAHERDQWLYARLPDNFNAVIRPDAHADQVEAVVAKVRSLRPAVTVEQLDAIGVLTVTTSIGTFAGDAIGEATVPGMDAAADLLRASDLFSSIDWTGAVLRIPNSSWPATAATDDVLAPECLRDHTREPRDHSQLTTSPSFATPLGTGPIAKAPACD